MPRAPWWKGERGEWYVVVQFVLFAFIALGPRTLPGVAEWGEPWARATSTIGALLMLTGVTLAIWGLIALGSQNLTALPYPRDEAVLVTTGPYAIVRNPIYSGLILGSFGWGLWLHAPLTIAFAVALFVLFDLKTRKEEAWLAERFTAYREYCKHVRKLIPWLY